MMRIYNFKGTVLKWEKGISQPSLSNFMLLCEVLDVSADYMLGISEYK